jgi:hypothetical protein
MQNNLWHGSLSLSTKDSFRGKLAIKPINRPHCEGSSSGPEIGYHIRCPRTRPFAPDNNRGIDGGLLLCC